MKINKSYLVIITLFILLNSLILFKWITAEYDNNFAGGIVIPFLGFSCIILNCGFFIVFVIKGIIVKKKRRFYFFTALTALIPLILLILTGL